jgi:hypothetical protein
MNQPNNKTEKHVPIKDRPRYDLCRDDSITPDIKNSIDALVECIKKSKDQETTTVFTINMILKAIREDEQIPDSMSPYKPCRHGVGCKPPGGKKCNYVHSGKELTVNALKTAHFIFNFHNVEFNKMNSDTAKFSSKK